MEILRSKKARVGAVVAAGAVALGLGIKQNADNSNVNSRPANNHVPAAEATGPVSTLKNVDKPESLAKTATTNAATTTTTVESSPPSAQVPVTGTISETERTPTNSGQFIYDPNNKKNLGGEDVPDQGPAWDPHDAVTHNGPLG